MSGFSRHLLSFGLAAAAFFVASGSAPAGAQTPTFLQLPTATADPTAITAGSDGNFWVAEFLGNKIAQITPSGTVTEFPIPTPNSFPNGITAGPDGNLWFAEQSGDKIGRITTAGVITEYPIPSGNGAGAIAVGPDGNLWFGEPVGNRVGRIATSGVISEFALPAENGPGGPTSIATGSDGALWLTLPGLNSIARITSDGATVSVFPIPTANSGPQTIALGPDGNLYFTESNVNQIGQITPDPSITEFPLPAGTTPFGIAAGPQGTVWFTGLGNNSVYQMILPLPALPGANQPIFTPFVLSKSCGPSQIASGPYTFPDIVFSCADTVLDSIGTISPPAGITLTVNLLGTGVADVTSIPSGINCFLGTLPGQNDTCTAVFPPGQSVLLIAHAAPTAAAFAGWNLPPAGMLPGCGGTILCELTLTSDTTVTATFNALSGTKELSVTLGGTGLFVLDDTSQIFCSSLAVRQSNNCSATYPTGTVVTLTGANNNFNGSDVLFAGWSGGGCTGTGDCTIRLLADTEVTALAGPVSGGTIPARGAAATLPTDRNVSLGENVALAHLSVLATSNGLSGLATNTVNTVTIFGTMINPGSTTATNCAVQPSPLANLPGAFTYQTTDPRTNALTGTANTPVNIPPGQAQSFVLAFTPTLPFGPVDVPLIFSCANLLAAPSVSGLDTVLLAASTTGVPDVIALGATTTNDQILHITGSTGSGAFAVATINLGAGDTITVGANTGGSNIPVSINLCQTNPQSGQCLAAPAPSVTAQINPNDTPTFGIFVTALDSVQFDPTDNRIFVSFFDSGGTQRGGTSVAVETQ